MNVDGSEQRNLSLDPFTDDLPAWSPNGSQIIFTSDRSGNNEVYRVEADGSALLRLTHSNREDITPAWWPNGKKILFVSERDRSSEIYIMNPDGTRQERISRHPGDKTWPLPVVFSPDNRIAKR